MQIAQIASGFSFFVNYSVNKSVGIYGHKNRLLDYYFYVWSLCLSAYIEPYNSLKLDNGKLLAFVIDNES